MKQRIQTVLVLGVVLGAICLSHGFSLLGPLDGSAWQTSALGYQRPGDIGCPVNLNEEYRWNNPVLTYAFDQSFLNYFGMEGVRQVEEAIAVLNDLPAVSQLSSDLSEYPTDNKRINYTAQALGIQDLKSTTLSTLLELMGLAAPERWVWCLRDRYQYTIGGTTYTNYLVIQRNFDPVSMMPTNRVNSIFYDYTIEDPYVPGVVDAVESPLDAVGLLPYSSVAGGYLDPGWIYTGLTRDDVGGLRYLLRARNFNIESLPTGVTMYTNTNTLNGFLNSPWSIYMGSLTNGTTNFFLTNIFVFTNPPWTIFLGQSNQFLTNLTNVAITNAVGTNAIAALRPGLEHIKFVRTDYDSLLGQGFTPITNVYVDTIITNFIAVTQTVQRVIAAPDILFAAQDLGTVQATPNILTRSVQFINNDAINGNTPHAGPGNLAPPVQITYSDILPGFMNDSYPYNMSNSIRTMVWGSFKATMDVPITVYPDWISIQELEAIIQSQ